MSAAFKLPFLPPFNLQTSTANNEDNYQTGTATCLISSNTSVTFSCVDIDFGFSDYTLSYFAKSSASTLELVAHFKNERLTQFLQSQFRSNLKYLFAYKSKIPRKLERGSGYAIHSQTQEQKTLCDHCKAANH